jgi:anti-anti-sigma factor
MTEQTAQAAEMPAGPATQVIRLEGELTIYRAAELKAQMLPLPADGSAVEIDLAGVSEIDTAGVQLLLLARREALAAQRALRLVGHSRAIRDVLTLLDLHRELGPSH